MNRSLSIIHSESSKGWGGQEMRTLREMIGMRDTGHRVELICPRDASIGMHGAAAGFAVHHSEMRTGGDVASAIDIACMLRRRACDVLNTHSGQDSLVAGFAARLAGTPLVVRTRHLALPITSLATYNWLPHRVIAVSHHVRKYLIGAGVGADRVETIYDGIEKLAEGGKSTLRTELGLRDDDVVACMVAIMREGKGHEDLIAAVVPLLESREKFHVVLAGDGPMFAEIKRMVLNRGLEHRIHLLGFRSDVPNIMAGCDFFVLPTHQEALGQAFIEAMSLGLPVIGTDVGGVPELISDEVNGLLVPPRDPVALAEALVRLIDNASLRHELSHAGRFILSKGFSVTNMVYDTMCFYRRSLQERGYHA
ncbi:glycosyl transferase [Caballeronia megalochromosomata]|nr:glycosyl transferase [Caballeronia megalochromosomata]